MAVYLTEKAEYEVWRFCCWKAVDYLVKCLDSIWTGALHFLHFGNYGWTWAEF